MYTEFVKSKIKTFDERGLSHAIFEVSPKEHNAINAFLNRDRDDFPYKPTILLTREEIDIILIYVMMTPLGSVEINDAIYDGMAGFVGTMHFPKPEEEVNNVE